MAILTPSRTLRPRLVGVRWATGAPQLAQNAAPSRNGARHEWHTCVDGPADAATVTWIGEASAIVLRASGLSS
jgi:hypothetical protein